MLRQLLPKHAVFIAKSYEHAIFEESCAVEFRTDHIREHILRYHTVGAFTEDNPSEPVGWCFRKKGNYIEKTPITVHSNDLGLVFPIQILNAHSKATINGIVVSAAAGDSIGCGRRLFIITISLLDIMNLDLFIDLCLSGRPTHLNELACTRSMKRSCHQ